MPVEILELDAQAAAIHADALAYILADSVSGGAAVGFMAPLPPERALAFWLTDVLPELAGGRRHVFAALLDGEVVGTVQLITAMPPNQPHRGEIAKMMVHRRARCRGIGRLLVRAALDRARAAGKTLVTLDTRTGDVAEPLYASVGFEPSGMVPDFAWDPDGRARHATTYMYCRL